MLLALSRRVVLCCVVLCFPAVLLYGCELILREQHRCRALQTNCGRIACVEYMHATLWLLIYIKSAVSLCCLVLPTDLMLFIRLHIMS